MKKKLIAHPHGSTTPGNKTNWAWIHHLPWATIGMAVAALATSVAIWFLVRYEHKTREDPDRRKAMLEGGRNTILVLGAFLGVLLGSKFTKLDGLDLPSWLKVAGSVVACIMALRYLWTMILQPAHEGMLPNGGTPYNLDTEISAYQKFGAFDETYFEAIRSFLTPEWQATLVNNVGVPVATTDYLVVAVAAVLKGISGIAARLSSPFELHGAVQTGEQALSLATAVEAPASLTGVVEQANQQGTAVTETRRINKRDVYAVACPVRFDDAHVTALMWGNMPFDAVRTAQFWATFMVVLDVLRKNPTGATMDSSRTGSE